MSWNNVRNRINAYPSNSDSWRSDRESLLAVVDQAERWGLDPAVAEQAPLSNLRAAAGELKRAVRWGDPGTVDRTLRLAGNLPNRQFRLAIHTVRLENVSFVRSGNDAYQIHVTSDQLDELARAASLRFHFQEGADPEYK